MSTMTKVVTKVVTTNELSILLKISVTQTKETRFFFVFFVPTNQLTQKVDKVNLPCNNNKLDYKLQPIILQQLRPQYESQISTNDRS